ETPWVAGNFVFVLSSDNVLVALGREDGVIRWTRPLPRHENEKSRTGTIFWTGPVLAGGRLLLAGSNGDMVEIRPENGALIRVWPIGKSVRIPPIVAGGVLYV